MRKHGMPEVNDSHPNVTPLIDVVMCLIIFFMLVAKIGVNTGADQSINIPESIMGKKIEDMGNTLVLNLAKQSDTTAAKICALVPDKETGKPEKKDLMLINRSRPEKEQKEVHIVLLALAEHNENFNLIIRADSDLPYSEIEPVLMAAAESKVKTVSLNTKLPN